MRFFSFLILLQLFCIAGSSTRSESIKLVIVENEQIAENDPFYYPYSPTSAFNRTIGTGAEYSALNSQLTIDIKKVAKWGFNTRNGWSIAVAKSTASDPMVTVTCSSTDVNRNVNFPYKMRIPQGFPMSSGVQAETSDGQIAVYDETTGIMHEFYKFKWNNGNPKADIHYTNDPDIDLNPANPTNIKITPDQNIITGNGHGSFLGQIVGSRAVGTAGFAGLIRKFELTDPNTYPQHALVVELSYGQLLSVIQWPACAKDWASSTNTGSIPYGSLVAIPSQSKGGPDLTTLGLTDAGMRIAKTLVYYGAYVADRRGDGAGIEGDQYIPDAVCVNIVNDIQLKLMKYFRIVTNNLSTQSVSGGGISIFPTTGNSDSGSKKEVCFVYPNPVKESINIQVSETSEAAISDLTGRVLLQNTVAAGNNRINLNLNPGIYILQVIGNHKSIYSSKLVIE